MNSWKQVPGSLL